MSELQESMLTVAARMEALARNRGLPPVFVLELQEAANERDPHRMILAVGYVLAALAESRQEDAA